jgi:Protein of unknown function (DUF2917)
VDTTACMTETHEPSWQLAAGQVQAVPSAARGRWLQARAGRLWLTRLGAGPAREADVWLQPGQRHWLAPGSDWLIEGWGASAFELLEPPSAQLSVQNRLPKPMPTSSGSTLKVPALAPKDATSVWICTFFRSRFSSQPPPMGTSTPT